jgi:hypothetical protein
VDESKPTVDGLLQTNATVIAGVLIFVTVTSVFGSITTGLPLASSRALVIYFTTLIIVPFAISAILILRGKKVTRGAVSACQAGFGALVTVVSIILVFSFVTIYYPDYWLKTSQLPQTIVEQCALNPKSFNVTHVFDCSKFEEGSTAQMCALAPDKFRLKLSQCHEFTR